ncbi:MAG: phospholipase D family protein [Gammaproteobacteria bacterium]|nr:phospholipase D family protein [Gammaproteobacteria bacterium]
MEILNHENMHQRIVEELILEAKERVWIATANLKDMHIKARRGYKPILDEFDRMARDRGVSFRIIHADKMSKSFQNTLNEYSLLKKCLEIQICPRSHWKLVIVDGKSAYFGSANFTGAGLGVKNINRRNLELGALITDKASILQLESWFDSFWIGENCIKCERRKYCPDPIA